jgi:chromosome segregation ATPase
MPGKDFELERLRSEMDAAQREVDSAKARLDPIGTRRDGIKSQINSVKYRIDDIKHSIDEEYRMMKICYQSRDRIGAENHKYNAESFKGALQREYEIKKGYYDELHCLQNDFESALDAVRSAKERKQRAREAFNARLELVKAQNERERAKWKEKPCKICGAAIRYHIEWNRVPDLCKSCQEREKAKWHETTCKKCGKTIRYHQDWTYIPSICKECKTNHSR